MWLQRMVSEMMVAGVLVGCARSLDDRGGAPIPEEAESYMSQRLTVVGEVGEVRGEHAFTVKHSDRTADERLLVIATRSVRQVIT
jgi:hypothetical protein